MEDGRQTVVVELPWKRQLSGQLAEKKEGPKDNEENRKLKSS